MPFINVCFKSFIDQNAFFILFINRDYEIVYINQSLSKFKTNDVIGKNCLELLMRRDNLKLKIIFDRVFDSNEPERTIAESMVDSNGNVDWCEIGVSPIKVKDFDVVKYLAITSVDVTQRVLSENENAEIRNRLESIVKRQEIEISTQKAKDAKKNRGLLKCKCSHFENKSFTKRENEIFKYVQLGFTTKEIANMLFVSDKTIKKHRENINKKLQELIDSELSKSE